LEGDREDEDSMGFSSHPPSRTRRSLEPIRRPDRFVGANPNRREGGLRWLAPLPFRALGLPADYFLAVDFFAVDFLAVDFFAVDFLAVDFFAVDLFAVAFLAVDLFAVAFLAVDLFAVAFLAVDFLAVDFFAVDFLAVDLFAVVFLAVDFFAAGMFTPFREDSGRHPLQASAFPFAHTAPDAVALVAAQGVVQALDADGTVGTDPLRLPGRPSLLGEEDLGVVVPAASPLLPRNEMVHGSSPELHCCNSARRAPRIANRTEDFFPAPPFRSSPIYRRKRRRALQQSGGFFSS
jgi:hypothetical protein